MPVTEICNASMPRSRRPTRGAPSPAGSGRYSPSRAPRRPLPLARGRRGVVRNSLASHRATPSWPRARRPDSPGGPGTRIGDGHRNAGLAQRECLFEPKDTEPRGERGDDRGNGGEPVSVGVAFEHEGRSPRPDKVAQQRRVVAQRFQGNLQAADHAANPLVQASIRALGSGFRGAEATGVALGWRVC